MGTPSFAVPSLLALHAAHEVEAVFTRPDAVAGRGGSRRPCDVARAARELGLPVMQPQTLRGEATASLAEIGPDVVCVAAYGMLLPPETLAVPRYGCINVHASLLPRHRGAAPVQRAILAGDATTGVSIMLMEEGLDTGPYAVQRTVEIGERYAADVESDLAHAGADALVAVLATVEDGTVTWTPQDDSLATYATKVTKDDVALLPEISVREALLRVRASSRSAPARACLGDREMTVVRASITSATAGPGAVCIHEGAPVLGFADGALRLDVVRPAGKGDMPGSSWVLGARLPEGVCWRCTR